MLKGVPVSPGVAVARAYCVDQVLAPREPNQLEVARVSEEVGRFDGAVAAAGQELDAIVARVCQQLGEEEAAIFRGHRLLLRDPALIGKVKSAILHRHIDAQSALHEVLDEYANLFATIQDEYLKERMADIRDVIGRIMAQLALNEPPPPALAGDEPVILVAPEILPSQALLLKRFNVVGILKQVKTGDLLALDARAGSVYLRPDAETEAAYRKLQREYVNLRDKLVENRDQESITRDGIQVELLANVNGLS